MKWKPLAVAGMLGLSALGLSGVLHADAPKTADKSVSLDDIDQEKVKKIGSQASGQLFGTLIAQISMALGKGEPVDALKFCSDEALTITADIQEKLPEGTTINRTTNKWRNPKNQPTEHEQKALDHFEKHVKEGTDLPQNFLQIEGDRVGYYQPLKLVQLCTTCHGSYAEMDDTLVSVLKERYPNDKAHGYSEGDFRGVIRVAMPLKDVLPADE